MSDITVIGLGAMGTTLAETLIAAGLKVTVWNRSPAKAEPLVAKGATHAPQAADAITASPVSLLSVLDDRAVREILETAAGRLARRTLINLTNGTPAQTRELAAWAENHGAEYIGGAVMVPPELVGDPESFLLYSGAEAAYRQHEKTLALLGQSTYIGNDPVSASLYDLALLSSMYGMFGGYLQAAALLRSENVPVTEVTPMIMSLLQAMIELFPQTAREIDTGEYPRPTSNNAMMAAGLRNILDGSREQGVREDVLEPVWKLFDRAANEGLGDHDISALVPLLAVGPGASGRTSVR